jgi:hypothetical protein
MAEKLSQIKYFIAGIKICNYRYSPIYAVPNIAVSVKHF